MQKIIHVALQVITLGQMRDYLDGYQTTLGQRVYVSGNWHAKSPGEKYVTLSHERIHIVQFQRFTLLGMAILYLLVPLPMGLAYFRARFEKQAYGESIRAAAELYGVSHVKAPGFREHIINQFMGPSYGWMWPFRGSLNRWYDGQLAQVSALEAR